jgi:transcriptional regulator with XRE-family HTH domain
MSGYQQSGALGRNVGQRLRHARQHRGLTQRAVAKRLGVSYQLVQQYERGEKLSLDRMLTLGAILKVNWDWLLTGTAARAPPLGGRSQ